MGTTDKEDDPRRRDVEPRHRVAISETDMIDGLRLICNYLRKRRKATAVLDKDLEPGLFKEDGHEMNDADNDAEGEKLSQNSGIGQLLLFLRV